MGKTKRGQASKPGICVLGTRLGAGKTLVAATLCLLLRQRGLAVGVFKPIDFACQRRQRQGLVSPDAELLSHFADSALELAALCPLRLDRWWYARPGRAALKWNADWKAMWQEYRRVCQPAEVMIVEGCGGVMTPLDSQRTMLDLAGEFSLDILLVVPAGPDLVHETLVAAEAVRSAGLQVADVVINRYDPERAGAADERAAEVIAGLLKLSLPVIVPPVKGYDLQGGRIGRSVRFPLSLWVDKWLAKSGRKKKTPR